jgi:protein-tyrosine phosphatase
MIKILFVCAGNICRSPMAEAVFQEMVNKAGLGNQIRLDSAGTGAWHLGEKANPRTLNVLKKHNIPYDGRARQIKDTDLEEFDYVLAMDNDNLSDIRHRFRHNKAKVGLFLEYAKAAGTLDVDEVPDPYYDGDDAFAKVYDLVTKGSTALLAHIQRELE